MSPRTSTQLQALREERSMQILRAALKVFANQGYNGSTIEMIAREAGVAKGLLYSYFESKEKLLESLITYGLEKASAFLTEPPDGPQHTKEAFAANLRKMVQLFREEQDFWRLYSMLILQPKMAEKFKADAMSFLETYMSVYGSYFQQKQSKNPMAEAMLFGAVLDGLMFDLILSPDEYPLEEVLDMIIEKFA
ncbi:MAG: TetR/AcrR family transcriptional regulator [Lewinellaceae bacterium]|nr:TetR/AcrR family transcriptional regulator [Saprospiraceae bacterium]MCB9345017.1 TetR/AcrR family transcriptional regulator [Lewinellaceae bacterium]